MPPTTLNSEEPQKHPDTPNREGYSKPRAKYSSSMR